jgi:polyhydroxyalkanoate synthesis regulator phasin
LAQDVETIETTACQLADILKNLVEAGVIMNLEEIEETVDELKTTLSEAKGARHSPEDDARIILT